MNEWMRSQNEISVPVRDIYWISIYIKKRKLARYNGSSNRNVKIWTNERSCAAQVGIVQFFFFFWFRHVIQTTPVLQSCLNVEHLFWLLLLYIWKNHVMYKWWNENQIIIIILADSSQTKTMYGGPIRKWLLNCSVFLFSFLFSWTEIHLRIMVMMMIVCVCECISEDFELTFFFSI